MSLLPESASFEELVQDYFLAVRGAGLMLSALDTELLTAWAQQGVPFEVVARGISRSAEKALWDARPGEPVLRSLRACRKQVETEIRKYRDLSAGQGEDPPAAPSSKKRPARSWEEVRHARLCSALRAVTEREAALAPRVHRLLDTVLACVPREPAAMDQQEALALLGMLRALPFAERRTVWRDARTGEQQLMTVRARRVARRFRLQAAVRRRLDMKET
jgi:hypothetical protein